MLTSKYDALIALVLTGTPVSVELADLLVAGAAPTPAPARTALFSRPLVAGELECLVSAGLDAESASPALAEAA